MTSNKNAHQVNSSTGERQEARQTGGTDTWPRPEAGAGWRPPVACQYCGSGSLASWLDRVRDHLEYVPGSWAMLRCRDCGSVQLSPMPSEDKVAELYPPVYSFRTDLDAGGRIRRLISRAEEAAFYRILHKRETGTIRRHTGLAGGNLLDVGCGTGDRLARFSRTGFSVRGLEIQPDLVRYVRQTRGFAVDAGTLDSVFYPAASFDMVTIYYVIEHLLDVGKVLWRIHSMLKPGGWVVAEVPLADSCQSLTLRTRWSQYSEAPRHVSIPSREGIRRALTVSGFEEVSILPATMMNCAAAFALSVIPAANTGRSYARSGVLRHLPRAAGGLVTLLYCPAAALENYGARRPAFGLVLARKPGEYNESSKRATNQAGRGSAGAAS